MRSGEITSSAGTIRRLWRHVIVPIALAAVCGLAQAHAQSVEFSAAPTVFPTTGSNLTATQTVAIQVVSATAIRSLVVPIGFITSPDFVLISQAGCVIDGVTVNAAGTVCTATVAFNPVAAGLRTGSLIITDGNGVQTAFGLAGVGYYPQVAVTPAAAKIAIGLGPAAAAFSGDGASATVAATNTPMGIAADSFGNVFFADTANSVVRMLDAFGNVTTIAGGGTLSPAASDGGPAIAAQLLSPTWLAVDSAGNLYIAESGRNLVRRVAMSTGGSITTYAGTTSTGSFGDGPPLTIAMSNPQGLAMSPAGELYIADMGRQRIRKVDATGTMMSVVAGNGTQGHTITSSAALSAQFDNPQGLALDLAGNLYIADTGNSAVRELTTGGQVVPFAGTGTYSNTGDGGLAVNATLESPAGLAVNAAGDVYVVDSDSGIVRKVETSTGNIETVMGVAKDAGSYTAGVSVATSTRMNEPTAVAFDTQQNLYVADTGNNVVRLVPSVPGELAFAAQAVGDTSSASTVRVANIGNAPVTVAAINPAGGTASNFVLNNSGNGNCLGTVASGAHCALSVAFAPQTTGFLTGELDLIDYPAGNANTTYSQPIYLLGGLQTALTIGPATLPGISNGTAYDQTITAAGGFGALTVTTSGTLPAGITATIGGSTIHLAGTTTATGSFTFIAYATDALGESAQQSYTFTLYGVLPLAITESIHTTDTITPLQGLLLPVTETIHTLDSPSLLPGLSLPVTETIHTTDLIASLPGLTLSVMESITTTDSTVNTPGKQPQTITAPTIGAHTYGDASFVLSATASSGLPVTIAVQSGPATLAGSTLDLTGGGVVTLTLTQTGNDSYSAAAPVSVSFTVARAAATITAVNASRAYLAANPAFTFTAAGLVHGDTASTLGGAPALTTTAQLNSAAGTYPIAVVQGSLPTTNYSFSFVAGTLTVTGHSAQTITFTQPPNVPLTVGGITLSAHSTSGLAIVYNVSGPATIGGSRLTLTGKGQVTVTATQPGNATYDPAPNVTRTFTVQ